MGRIFPFPLWRAGSFGRKSRFCSLERGKMKKVTHYLFLYNVMVYSEQIEKENSGERIHGIPICQGINTNKLSRQPWCSFVLTNVFHHTVLGIKGIRKKTLWTCRNYWQKPWEGFILTHDYFHWCAWSGFSYSFFFPSAKFQTYR